MQWSFAYRLAAFDGEFGWIRGCACSRNGTRKESPAIHVLVSLLRWKNVSAGSILSGVDDAGVAGSDLGEGGPIGIGAAVGDGAQEVIVNEAGEGQGNGGD